MVIPTRAVVIAALLAVAADVAAQTPQEIRLWPGKAPGSENWSVPETTTTSPSGDRTIANVSDPSVTVYLPPAATATGAAVVVAPGGALRLLGWDGEGIRVAQWLNSKGIAALVLKYRTLQSMPAAGRGRGAGAPGGAAGAGPAGRQELDIKKANANPAPDDAALTEVLRMARRRRAAGAASRPPQRHCLAHRSRAHRHHGVLRRRRCRRRDGARRTIGRIAGLPRLGVWSVAAGRRRAGARAAALRRGWLDALQRHERLPGPLRRLEGCRQAGGDPCLRSGQRRDSGCPPADCQWTRGTNASSIGSSPAS